MLEPSDLVLEACFLLKAPFRGMLLTLRGGPKSLAPRAHRIPVYPMVFSTFLYRAFTAHFDFDVGLVHPPADPHGTLAAVERLFQRGTILDDPPVDRGMIHVDTPFEHEFFDMARAQGIGHLPADPHQNDLWGEMGTFETDRHRRSPS